MTWANRPIPAWRTRMAAGDYIGKYSSFRFFISFLNKPLGIAPDRTMRFRNKQQPVPAHFPRVCFLVQFANDLTKPSWPITHLSASPTYTDALIHRTYVWPRGLWSSTWANKLPHPPVDGICWGISPDSLCI